MAERIYGFFCELRRRKVYRVAAGYAVTAWLLIQIAATTFPALDFPAWTLRAVIVCLGIGFPFALILAWAFDVGPHGFERTAPPPKPAEDCPPALAPKRRNVYVLGVSGLLIAAFAAFFLWPRSGPAAVGKSIAVLPFANFSASKENEHFADGIHEDLLTTLAKIGELKVISRTSVMPYKDKPHNVREIGRALGVGAVLEGSVQRDGNRIRINVQLINAANDHHLWAERYDRELTDVFAIQSSLAQEIATQLKAQLSSREKAQVTAKPTQNSDAYMLYVQAQAIATGPDTERRKEAEPLFEQAIALDPSFALAYARLSWLQSWLYHSMEPTEARLTQARATANEALRLQPDLPEAHLALGFTHYYGEYDYDRALDEFQIAARDLPNDSNVFRAIAALERRRGNWQEALRNYDKAVALNPRDSVLLENLGLTHMWLRNYPAAAEAFDRALAAAPDAFEIASLRAWVDVYAHEDFSRFHELLATNPKGAENSRVAALARWNVQFFERRFDEALADLAKAAFDNMRGETSAPLPKSFLAGQTYRAIGDQEHARAAYQQAREIVARTITDSPKDAARWAVLGHIDAALGRSEDALREGEHAIELLPESKDAFDGPIVVIALARIQTFAGKYDDAITTLEHSLQTPGGITVAELRLEPTWDALRQFPRFQKLIERR